MQSNLKIFIASIYMNGRKVLKEGMRIVCCQYIYDNKSEHPEEEVMQLVEVTTRWREGSSQMHSLCLNHEKDRQPESLETLR